MLENLGVLLPLEAGLLFQEVEHQICRGPVSAARRCRGVMERIQLHHCRQGAFFVCPLSALCAFRLLREPSRSFAFGGVQARKLVVEAQMRPYQESGRGPGRDGVFGARSGPKCCALRRSWPAMTLLEASRRVRDHDFGWVDSHFSDTIASAQQCAELLCDPSDGLVLRCPGGLAESARAGGQVTKGR